MNVPPLVTAYVFAGSITIIVALLFGLRSSLIKAGWREPERSRVLRVALLMLVAWFILAIALAWMGAYRSEAERMPRIQYGLLVPIAAGLLLLWGSARLARVIDAVPQQWLVGIQLYRAIGAIFLVLYAFGLVPGLFAWPTGLGDVLVAVLAPVVAIAYRRAPRRSANLVLAWNILGLADLVVAVATGVLTSPSPLQRFAFDAPNEVTTLFPMVLIPTFLVPISILLHAASLKKLHAEMARTSSEVPLATKW